MVSLQGWLQVKLAQKVAPRAKRLNSPNALTSTYLKSYGHTVSEEEEQAVVDEGFEKTERKKAGQSARARRLAISHARSHFSAQFSAFAFSPGECEYC